MTWSENRALFLEWLTDERHKGELQVDFARALGVDPGRLSEWKREPEFLDRWEAIMRERYGHPEKLSEQLENLHKIATGRHRDSRASDQIKATTSYWALLGKNAPARSSLQVQAVGAADVRELSDRELREARERVLAIEAGEVVDAVVVTDVTEPEVSADG